jgi:hypothetical protein
MARVANDVDAAQLSVGADAISGGVSEAVLEKITASASRDRRTVAVAVLTQLVLHGIAPEAALVQVKDAFGERTTSAGKSRRPAGRVGRPPARCRDQRGKSGHDGHFPRGWVFTNTPNQPTYHSVKSARFGTWPALSLASSAGIVLVDPTQEETFSWNQEHGFEQWSHDKCGLKGAGWMKVGLRAGPGIPVSRRLLTYRCLRFQFA